MSERQDTDKATRRWLKNHTICEADDELASHEQRILLAIRKLGYLSFREFLAAHTIDEKTGDTWSLTDQAKALEVSRPPYICYHTRWVELNAPEGVIK